MTISKNTWMTSLAAAMLITATASSASADPLTPVVVFPAFHFTRLEVTVQNQTAVPGCPTSGQFEDWFLNPNPGTQFSQVCRDELMTLVVEPSTLSKPMKQRFSNQPGVQVRVKDYGSTTSAPFYEDLYAALEAAGYVRDVNIRVAGYDSRLTPDIGNFMDRTIKLIEDTYYSNQSTPVHLVGHSNGPLYAQYLLTHTTKAWRDRFIHGFTPLAGNWPGQGLFYPVYFTGLNIIDFAFPTDPANAASSALMYQSHPSSYMSSADPDVFGDQEIVLRTAVNGVEYTPADNLDLFADAGLYLAGELAAHYTGFVALDAPDVDVYAEKGSGLQTVVGLELPNLSVGQVVSNTTTFFTRDGDANQEDITNDAIAGWASMPCHRFEFTNNVGVDHFSLASDAAVLQRLLTNLSRARSVCP
ncbi:MAG: hypothetical protein IT372_22095 [Polyangiaceae bacterium]|nr:hypothetical protein [Polyangiaceae bacterium]